MHPVPGTIAVSRASSIPLHTNIERGGAAGTQERRPKAGAEHWVGCTPQATLQARVGCREAGGTGRSK